jgi:colanic acid biosynthesis protein WcaH
MPLPEAIRAIEEIAGDPRSGLPEELFLFVSRMTPLVNVDLLIQDDDHRTLLTWRSDQFYGSGWHVPGGIIRYKEPAQRRIQEVARQELGATVEFGESPIAVIESISRQSNRGHFISLLYRCRLSSPPDPLRQALSDPPAPGSWLWHTGSPGNLLEAQNIYKPFL